MNSLLLTGEVVVATKTLGSFRKPLDDAPGLTV